MREEDPGSPPPGAPAAGPPLPVLVRLAGRRCLVVGGGRVAVRKVGGLLGAGARVEVASPALHPDLAALAEEGRVRHLARRLEVRHDQAGPALLPEDAALCRGAALVVAATDSPEVNQAVVRACRELGVWVNAAGDEEGATLLFPSCLRRGRLTVAVSTGGASPALAARLRRELEAWLAPEFEQAVEILAAARQVVLEAGAPERRRLLLALGALDLVGPLRRGGVEAVWPVLAGAIGKARVQAVRALWEGRAGGGP